MCGRRQGPRRQDHGSVGDGSGAASARADTRQDRDYSARERSGSRAQNAGGYDGRGDQHSLSDRFEPAGGWGQGADPHHEKDHQNCGRGWNRVARSESKRAAQGAGDCARGARQRWAKPREAKVGLQQITTCDQSSGRSGEAVRRGDRRWSEAVEVPLEAVVLEGLRQELETMVPLVKQVTKQTRARIFRGDTRTPGKILSLFEPSTELIRKGKAAKPNEFGKMVKLQEAENQIVVDYAVYAQRPNDADLLIPAIETHRAKLGRTPYLVAADAGFYSAKNEAVATAKGVKRVCIPNRSTKSKERRREQRKRWFRNGQKWRTGCEGRISVVKRRHGLNRCRYRGEAGMQRWVGLAVIADNLVNIGRAL